MSAGLKVSVPEPWAVMAGPGAGGQSGALRHWPSSASHSKVGSESAAWSSISQRRSQPTTRASTRLLSPCVRHTPWPPQNHTMCTGTPLAFSSSKLRIASLGVNRVSAVPCTSRVGTRICDTSASPGPRLSNQARSSVGQAAGGEPLGQRGGDVRIDGPRLDARRADDPRARSPWECRARRAPQPSRP